MLKSIYIKNYKNIKEIEIPNIKRVNLVWGMNNIGKSSLLEAISVYASGKIDNLFEILNIRGEDVSAFRRSEGISVEDEIRSFLPLVYNYQLDLLKTDGIIIGENQKNALVVRLVKRCRIPVLRGDVDSSSEYTMKTIMYDVTESSNVGECVPAIEFRIPGEKFYNIIEFDGGGIRLPRYAITDSNRIPYKYVSCKFSKLNDIDSLWSKISMTEYEHYVINALRIIEPKIIRFNVLTESMSTYRPEPIPYVLLEGGGTKKRLSAMGDGINRVLMIILALINCKDGVFLLDEFENGLHFSVQERLWEIIFDLAEKLNIQVFVTTHSNDCIDCFSKVAFAKSGLAIRLEQSRGEIYCQQYSDMEDLRFAVREGIELR